MKKALAMKCTQEQWDSIKGRFTTKQINSITSFETYPWLINFDDEKTISNISKDTYWENVWEQRPEIHETFNAKVFLDACGIDCEPKYSITKLQLTQLLRNNEEGNEQLVSADLRAWFPDVFKKELEVGKWMKTPIGGLYCPKEKQGNGFLCYGFSAGSMKYIETFVPLDITDNDIDATPQEVEDALISEAKKRGYKENIIIKGLGNTQDGRFHYRSDINYLYCGSYAIFQNGIWATIIQSEKMTLEQIEKELGRKIELI